MSLLIHIKTHLSNSRGYFLAKNDFLAEVIFKELKLGLQWKLLPNNWQKMPSF